MKKIYLCLMFILCVVGCVPRYDEPYKLKDYTQVDLIELPVSRINIEVLSAGDEKYPHVEKLMPMSVEKALRNWALIRLRPNYSTKNKASFIIENASMIEQDDNNDSFFTQDNYKYRLTYKIVLNVQDGQGMVLRKVETEGFVDQTLPKRASQKQRDILFMEMLGDVENQLDLKFSQEIKQNLVDLSIK